MTSFPMGLLFVRPPGHGQNCSLAYAIGRAPGDARRRERESSERKGGTREAYCLKCRTKREMTDPQEVTMKNGKPATMGKCPTCGTKMYKIGKK